MNFHGKLSASLLFPKMVRTKQTTPTLCTATAATDVQVTAPTLRAIAAHDGGHTTPVIKTRHRYRPAHGEKVSQQGVITPGRGSNRILPPVTFGGFHFYTFAWRDRVALAGPTYVVPPQRPCPHEARRWDPARRHAHGRAVRRPESSPVRAPRWRTRTGYAYGRAAPRTLREAQLTALTYLLWLCGCRHPGGAA